MMRGSCAISGYIRIYPDMRSSGGAGRGRAGHGAGRAAGRGAGCCAAGGLAALGLLLGVDPVQADGDRDDQRVVLAGRDIDSVRVADPEPLPRYPRDDRVAVADLEVLVDQVADRLEPPAAVGVG